MTGLQASNLTPAWSTAHNTIPSITQWESQPTKSAPITIPASMNCKIHRGPCPLRMAARRILLTQHSIRSTHRQKQPQKSPAKRIPSDSVNSANSVNSDSDIYPQILRTIEIFTPSTHFQKHSLSLHPQAAGRQNFAAKVGRARGQCKRVRDSSFTAVSSCCT